MSGGDLGLVNAAWFGFSVISLLVGYFLGKRRALNLSRHDLKSIREMCGKEIDELTKQWSDEVRNSTSPSWHRTNSIDGLVKYYRNLRERVEHAERWSS